MRTAFQRITVAFAALLLFTAVSGCRKKYQKYDFHLLVVDKETQQPMADVQLLAEYTGTIIPASRIGETGHDGTFKDKVRIKKGQLERIALQSTVDYLRISEPFILSGKFEMQYLYRYRIELQNTNCFNETDSVFVKVVGGDYSTFYGNHTGCEPKQFIVPQNNYSGKSTNPEIIVQVRVKRNGVVTEFEQVAGLQRNKTVAVPVEY